MRFLQSTWCPVCLGIITVVLILTSLLPSAQKKVLINFSGNQYKEGDEWIEPDENEIPYDSNGDLIRYGKELIVNTSKYPNIFLIAEPSFSQTLLQLPLHTDE